MKVRVGFVSNSSSTSYMIYGVSLSKSEVAKHLEVAEDDLDIWRLGGVGNLEAFCQDEDYGDIRFGRSWDTIKDDETGKEFKLQIEREVEEVFGKGHTCDTYEDAWYDG